MGEVVLAEHLGLGKLVVVKLLHEKFAQDPSFVKRMQIEARSIAALTSPHIVQVIDFGQTASGRTYYVMERLVGCTLGAEVKARGALPVEEAIGYVVQVLAGLEAAHAMGIIHRDIKADNIFLCDATKETPRTVKVLDFGVAKVLDVAAEVRRPALPHLVTEQGGIVGTPRMLAPEQALGKPVDARTDVYATAHLLYTLIAGRGPFAHLTEELDLLKANLSERPDPPSSKAPQHIPPSLDRAILRALEKRPADRFPSAEAFAIELRAIAVECACSGSPTRVETAPLPPTGAGGGIRMSASPAPRVQTGPLPPADAASSDDACEDATLQLPGGTMGVATTRPIEPARDVRRADGGLGGDGARGSSALYRGVSTGAALLAAGRRGAASRAGFVALMLLGAVFSAILLLTLSRLMP
jgi:serine/threonine-protein kinase